MNIQDYLNDKMAEHDAERSKDSRFLNLGEIISKLQNISGELKFSEKVGSLHSYRGYYCDLAIMSGDMQPEEEYANVLELLIACEDAVGSAFTGYKGGEFDMSKVSPVWFSRYGCCSELRIVDILEKDGLVHIVTGNVEDDENI